MFLTDEQYSAIEPIYMSLRDEVGEVVPNELLIARIETSEAKSLVFRATSEQIYHRYQMEVIHAFNQMWARRQAKRMIGGRFSSIADSAHRLGIREVGDQVKGSSHDATESPRTASTAPLHCAWENESIAETAHAVFEHGLKEIRKHGPYCEAWGEHIDELVARVMEVLDDVRQEATEMRPKTLAPTAA